MANIFEINRVSNKITLGTTDTTINIASHTASRILALDASKNLEVVTIGTSLDYTRPTLNTIQDIRTSASPQFVGIELGHATDTTITRVSAGVVAIEGTNIAMSGGAFHDGFSDSVANEHIDHTGVTLTAGSGLAGGGTIAANRSFDLDINSLTTVAIAAGDFVPFWDITATATNKKITFANFESTLDHDNLLNFASNEHFLQSAITTVGTIASGTWQGTTIAVNQGGTGQTTAQAAIDALSAVSGATDEHVLTKDTGTGQAKWKVAAGGADAFTVKIDAAATAGYIGASPVSGVLRTSTGLNYTDGGNFITLSVDVGIEDDEIVQIDSGTVVDNDYAKFTVNGLEGRSSAEVLSDLSGTMSATFNLNGQDLINGGIISLIEQAAAEGDIAGRGQIWVKTATPNQLWFTGDTGVDVQLGVGFGDWTDLDSASGTLVKDEVYKVGSDGTVCSYVYGNVTIVFYTDGSNPPTTIRQRIYNYGADRYGSVSVPIKKDDYFKITSTGTPTIYWLPIGTGTCVKQV